MEREAVLVGIDVGTSKVCALIGEVGRDGRLTIMGHGTVPASGLKKGVVVNIDQTVRSIADAVERAERLSGWKIDRAFVGVGGNHVESLNSTGQVAVTAHHREVTREDISRAIEVARAVSIPNNRDVLHVERRGFTVDGQEGVKDPLGMSALRLEVEAHIVTASATAVQNLTKCVQLAGVKIDELVADGLASSEAVLTETEKELGVAVADIGAGTIDLALFADGSPFHTSVLPVGGNNVTNDVAIGIKTTLQVAEELKVRHGTCDLRDLEDEEIAVSMMGDDAGRTVSREELCQIIEARMRETFELLRGEMTRSGHGMLPAGIILTGGAAQLAGTAELGRDVLQMPVRVGAPSGIAGLVDTIQDPSFSTAVGLLRWGAIQVAAGEPMRYESAPGGGGFGRLRDAIRSSSPRPGRPPARRPAMRDRSRSRSGPDATGASRDLTPGCARFAAEASAGGDGLLSVFVPARDGGRGDPRARRGLGHGRRAHARPPAAARRPLDPPPRVARPRRRPRAAAARRAVDHRPGRRPGGSPSGPGSRSRSWTPTPTTPTRHVRLSFLAG